MFLNIFKMLGLVMIRYNIVRCHAVAIKFDQHHVDAPMQQFIYTKKHKNVSAEYWPI